MTSAFSTKLYTPDQPLNEDELAATIDFLHRHLQQYGDAPEDIRKAIGYAMGHNQAPGGFVLQGLDGDSILGVVVVNETGMKGYIPENILVYIAVDQSRRGMGIGRQLMKKALQSVEGAVALHVEPDNPAKHLYERLGFTNKYLEMRYQK
ncbi:MAG: GNAT family N-acetyltransferase [Phaeodactylibacter sp.]|nr:GNAT family N-acetyltransferase [Phaeodactylibacter sp.]